MYTRNGEFQVDKNNFIVNAQGYRLTGYPANAIGANPVELQPPTANVAPKATSTATSVANLDANAKVIYQTTTVVSSRERHSDLDGGRPRPELRATILYT